MNATRPARSASTKPFARAPFTPALTGRQLVEEALPGLMGQLHQISALARLRGGLNADDVLNDFLVALLSHKADSYDPALGNVNAFVATCFRRFVASAVRDNAKARDGGPLKDKFRLHLRTKATRSTPTPVYQLVMTEVCERVGQIATPAQFEVVELLQRGHSRKTAALALGLTPKQVDDRMAKLSKALVTRGIHTGLAV